MTERETIAAITARLEERLAARLVDRIRPLLAGRSAEVRRTVLAALVAELIAGQPPDKRTDDNETRERMSVD